MCDQLWLKRWNDQLEVTVQLNNSEQTVDTQQQNYKHSVCENNKTETD